MKRILLAGMAGGLVYFVWGAVSWMVLPWHNATLKDLPGEQAILPVLRQNIGASGVYWFPGMQQGREDEQAMKSFEELHRAGPVGWLVYHAAGREPMPSSTFVKGFVIDFLAAFIAAALVASAGSASYGRRVSRVVLLGLFAGLVSHAAQWNWMLLPAGYAMTMIADLAAGWLLAGFAIAAIARPRA